MSEQIKDGGPAFPKVETTVHMSGDGEQGYTPISDVHSFGGMTLRDYFAAKALQGWLANGPTICGERVSNTRESAEGLSTASYLFQTDRELLELAAKAAGIRLEVFVDGKTIRRDADWQPIYWNPITDDGDALRLMVKLRLLVDVNADDCFVVFKNGPLVQPHDNNPYAATRRAIVRSAAAIGATK